MRLWFLIEDRSNKYSRIVQAGSQELNSAWILPKHPRRRVGLPGYIQGDYKILWLKTPEAIQAVSRWGCKSWHSPAEKDQGWDSEIDTICATHLDAVNRYLGTNTIFFTVLRNGSPWLLISTSGEVFDFEHQTYEYDNQFINSIASVVINWGKQFAGPQ